MALIDHLVASPCCNPELGLDEALGAYAGLGFKKFEVFDSWAGSAFDIYGDVDFYAAKLAEYGLAATSMHLPSIGEDLDITNAVVGARFADALGCKTAFFKAEARDIYIRAAGPFLDAVAGLSVVPIIQNHSGTPLATLDDYREVLAGINDPRMGTCLEVGHFHSVDVSWAAGRSLLGESIRLVHIKDQIGPQSVPFGTGEIDLPGLFAAMKAMGYTGDYVVEMEVADAENTLNYLANAIRYLQENCEV
jgi:sugar phosphate isomerase/epimerase